MARITLPALAATLALWAACHIAVADDAPAGEATSESEGAEKLVSVNGHVITREELETFFNAFFLTQDVMAEMQRLPPLQREQIYQEGLSNALRELTDRRLLLAAARKELRNTARLQHVIAAAVEERLEEMTKDMGSLVAVHRSLQQRNVSMRQWKALMGDTILVQHYAWTKIQGGARVSPGELRRYYRRHMESFRRPRRIRYRAILVDPADCKTPQEELAKAQRILAEIRQGGDFAALANRHSLDRGRRKGGLREVDAPQTPVDWLPPLCAGLTPGQVSEVQQPDAGYCIAKLEEIVPSHVPLFTEVQGEIRKTLIERARRESEKTLLHKLRSEANLHTYPAGERLLAN